MQLGESLVLHVRASVLSSRMSVNRLAVRATNHCLTGCGIGEVLGLVLATWWGWSDLPSIALAVALAFFFGYSLTLVPLLRAGTALGGALAIAFAADTLSITTMEIVDNLIMIGIPGAMESGVGSILFWGALSFALAVAFVLTVPVNRWLIARGKGHVAIHETGIHGGPPQALVATGVVAMFLFGTAVLGAELLNGDAAEAGGHGGGSQVAHEAMGESRR